MLDGKYLKYLRDSRGFTQKDIAELLGTSVQSYSRKEINGKFKAEELNQIRIKLGLTNEEYFRIFK